MIATAAVAVVGVVGVGLFLKLLVELSKDEAPGKKTTAYWSKFLIWLAAIIAVIIAAHAISEGWKR
jgi:uncharacterized membrane protein